MHRTVVQLTIFTPDNPTLPAVAVPVDVAQTAPPASRSRAKRALPVAGWDVANLTPTQLREAALAYGRGKISDLPVDEQPINRLAHYSPAALSNPELLAIVLGTQTGLADAEHLLAEFEGLPGLAQAIIPEITQHPGIGDATAARIKAAFELGRRLLIAAPAERPTVRAPQDAASLLMAEMSLLPQEHLRVVLLDTRNRVLAIPTITIGTLNSASIRIADIFRPAIRYNAAAMIVVHNHPSGDPTPSPEDVQVTRLIVEAGALHQIDIFDHLIIGRQRFVSLKERGLGFK